MPPAIRLDGDLMRYFCKRCRYPCVDGEPQEVCGVPPACNRRLHDPTYRVPRNRLAAVEVDMRQYLIQRVRDTGADQPFAAVIIYADLGSAVDPQRRYLSWSPPGYRGLSKALERPDRGQGIRRAPLRSSGTRPTARLRRPLHHGHQPADRALSRGSRTGRRAAPAYLRHRLSPLGWRRPVLPAVSSDRSNSGRWNHGFLKH